MPIIERGIQSNCSETVFRFDEKYLDQVPKESLAWGSEYSTEGYSQMLPTPGTICIYFYQTGGYALQEWLESNKIPYDIQNFMSIEEENFISIPMAKEEQESDAEGGSGEFLRRIPYRES